MENSGFKIEIQEETRSWHDEIRITPLTKHFIFRIKETIMGCGIAQLYGISNLHYLNTEEFSEFKDLITNKITDVETLIPNSTYKCMKVGLIIATLGKMYRSNNENLLLELGFKELSEYSNWRHDEDGKETQKLYGLKTNYKNKKNI